MAGQSEEARLSASLSRWLREKEGAGAPLLWEHRSGDGGFSYKKGRPDFWVVAGGKHLEIELKAKSGHLSAMQERFKWRCEKAGIAYCLARSLEEAASAIEALLP